MSLQKVFLIHTGIAVLGALLCMSCAPNKKVISEGPSQSLTGHGVTLYECSSVPSECETVHFILDAQTTGSTDPNFALGVFEAFRTGPGQALVCNAAATSTQCLDQVREFFIETCHKEVSLEPPLYSRKYTNPVSSALPVHFGGQILNFSFSEIVCNFSNSTLR